jgi:hypothetical protein
MATLVSTGQITIVDNNDARSIAAYLSSSGGTQQIFTKDESTLSFTPNYSSSALTITPVISISGLTTAEVWAALTNKQFALTQGGAALITASTSTSFVNNSYVVVNAPFTITHGAAGATTSSTFVLGANLLDTVGTFTVFFDADYYDARTTLTTHITCSITLNTVKTGTNAVYIMTRGSNSIEKSTTASKSNTAISVDLIRAGGVVDTSGITYKWYENNGSTLIDATLANVGTEYGFKTVASPTIPTGSLAELNVNIPAAGASTTYNTLVINENAVTKIGIYRVDVTDSDSKTYSTYFTIYDVSDPYTCTINSDSGDKLQNGKGSTNLTPSVWYGDSAVTLTGWSFTWYFWDKNGKRGAFIDTSKISTAGGAPITGVATPGNSAVISYSGTSYAFAAGDIIKCVAADGSAYFYEVASSTTNAVTIRTPSTNSSWLSFTNFPAPSSTTTFSGGKLYGCVTGGTRTTSAGASITLSGDEVDFKSRITVDANRP